ncbi:hypothetical protein PBI_TOURACH_69 [Mycobacterium phage Tourach]|uniref:Uncharacterized protein n=1 Tax=Mycobacterium phage Tourach TaxID=2599882 RepID=A0A5J6TWR0_9CAUD|nr:hypothetical protein J4T98_gp069 [Mycobacterium phage Tourach]QFG14307.1 hypothetical protein PBI_TOURACH_69 [Mycobacterium phage Tourach]
MGLAYPRRDDAVRYEKFDGTLESVQRIVNMTRIPVDLVIEPRDSFLAGDVLRISQFSWGNGQVNSGDYVTFRDKQVLVYPDDVFHAKFSTKDGWGN